MIDSITLPKDVGAQTSEGDKGAALVDKTIQTAKTPIPFTQLESLHGASLEDIYHHALKLNQLDILSDVKLNKIAESLHEIQMTLQESSQHRFVVRQARLSDMLHR